MADYYRVGRTLGRTIYNDSDILIGVMDTPELGRLVVNALNAYGGGDCGCHLGQACSHDRHTVEHLTDELAEAQAEIARLRRQLQSVDAQPETDDAG